MYDDLDGDVPTPGDEVRAAVLRRARGIQRRRRAAVVGSGAALTTLALLLGQTLVHAGTRHASLVVVEPTSTPTPSLVPDPTPTPSPTPTELPTPDGPTPTPLSTSTATTPTPAPRCFPADCPDGKPGWGTGFAWCDAGRAPLAGPVRNPDGLSLSFTLSSRTARAGQRLQGTLTLRNDGQAALELSWPSAQTADVRGQGEAGAVHGSDSRAMPLDTLQPGASVTQPVVVPTVACGDTSADPDVALPAGSYTVRLPFSYSARTAQASTSASSSPSPTAAPSREPWQDYGWNSPDLAIRIVG